MQAALAARLAAVNQRLMVLLGGAPVRSQVRHLARAAQAPSALRFRRPLPAQRFQVLGQLPAGAAVTQRVFGIAVSPTAAGQVIYPMGWSQ